MGILVLLAISASKWAKTIGTPLDRGRNAGRGSTYKTWWMTVTSKVWRSTDVKVLMGRTYIHGKKISKKHGRCSESISKLICISFCLATF